MEKLTRHIGYSAAKAGGRSAGTTDAQAREILKRDSVYVMGKIVPPRDCDSYDQSIWVSIEVRHLVGNLKNMPNADMITLQVPPEDLRPMIDPAAYEDPRGCAGRASAHKYTLKSRNAGQGGKKRKVENAADSDVGDEAAKPDEVADTLVISRFIFATRV